MQPPILYLLRTILHLNADVLHEWSLISYRPRDRVSASPDSFPAALKGRQSLFRLFDEVGIRVIGKGEMVFWINEGRRWPWKTVVAEGTRER